MFCVDLRTNSDYFTVYSINWLVFITETECVYCAVRSTFYVLPTHCIYVFCGSQNKKLLFHWTALTETERVYCAIGLGLYICFRLISVFKGLDSFSKLQVYCIIKLNTDNKVCVNSIKIGLCAQWGYVRYAEYVHTTQLHTAHFWCANRLLFVYVANRNPDSTTYTKGPTHIRQTQLHSTLKNLTVARMKPSSAGARKKQYTIVYFFIQY